MTNDRKGLQSIGEIVKDKFFIPSYQRGYKWEKIQVIELLEDILEFSNKKPRGEDEFYCIQPLVVRKDTEEEYYKVLDGQQRLTTIYLIIKHLAKDSQEIYSLEYKTRKDSVDFLNNISSENENSNSNSDYWFISRAYKAIKEWFTDKKDVNKEDFLETLLNNVKFIWYEVKETDPGKEIDTFTRLNMGKIPLTNAELIKGLFILDSDNKILLSTQWDSMESTLRNDEFFCFLFGKVKNTSSARIGYIFDLIADKEIENNKNDQNDLQQYAHEERKSYYVFNKLLNIGDKDKNIIVKKLWATVKNYFRIFTELYEDTEYYHLVGYLINRKSSPEKIVDIIDLFNDNTNDVFLDKLKSLAKMNLSQENLESLDFNDNHSSIHDVLFLFNALTSMQMINYKYSFNSHLNEKWELEHIHPQNPEGETDEQKQAIGNHNDNTISNIALLTKKINISVSNHSFKTKRNEIIEKYEACQYIPPCTLNVFLGYYNNDNNFTADIWEKTGRTCYLDAIKKTLKDYLTETNNDN